MTAPRAPLFQRVAIIGLGLIGGSLAAAIREQGLARTLVAGSRSTRTLEQGLALGLIDEGSQDLAVAVRGADLVFVATPVSSMGAVLKALRPGLAERAIVTDGGSVKGANAAELFAKEDIDGGLIGGAALNADDFLSICTAAARAN